MAVIQDRIMPSAKSGGGWPAIKYTLSTARKVGWLRLLRAMRRKNACKTCALGMGGQAGGMRNEAGHWPEVCKKSLQAMAADMQDGLTEKFFATYSLDELKTLSPRELEAAGRIVQPLYAAPGDTHYRNMSWDDALRRAADALKLSPQQQTFFYSSGRSSNEAGFLLQLFARCFGTNHVNNCSYYCHQASGVGLGESLGNGTATIHLQDLDRADLFFLIGGNPASNHPRLMRTLMQLRRRGGHVIVINPVREPGLVNFRVPSDVRSLVFGSDIASLYLQPHIGGDIAVLTGIAKCLLARGAIDQNFIDAHTEGWHDWRCMVEGADWKAIERAGGVPRDQLERAADLYVNSKSAIFGWTMGITHHMHGVENVQTIVNLALMRGMIGRPGAGFLPIRGHSNVQGIGTVGVAPALKQTVLERLESHFKLRIPTTPGYDTMSCLQAADRGEMRFALIIGGNLFGATPDAAFAARALAKIDTVVYLSTTLNTGHAHGLGQHTLVLPVLARDEEAQSTTQESMFNFVRLSEGGPARHAGPRSETAVIGALARTVLGDDGPVDWREMAQHSNIRRAIARIVPGMEPLWEIDQTKKEFHIADRLRHEPRFPTPSGKALFKAHAIPNNVSAGPSATAASPSDEGKGALHANGHLRLMTVRSEGQFNTVVYEEEDLYRGQDRRDVILLNPVDMARLGLHADQPVIVRSAAGQMKGILVRPFDIRAGNALMYYPEANILIPQAVDPRSKTPAYKSVLITLEPVPDFGNAPRPVQISISGPRRKLNAC